MKLVSVGIKKFALFPIGISLNVNVIAGLGFELAYFDIAVQQVYCYTTETPFHTQKKEIRTRLFMFIFPFKGVILFGLIL